MSDIQPHLTEKGAALLKARVTAETKDLGPGMERAKAIVEAAAKEMAASGTEAGAGFAQDFGKAVQGGFGDDWPKTLKLKEGTQQLSFEWASVPEEMFGAGKEGFTNLGLRSAKEVRESFVKELGSQQFEAPVFADGFKDKMGFKAADLFGWRNAVKESGTAGADSAQAFANGFGSGVEMHMPRAMRLLVHGHIAAAVIDIGKSALKAGKDLAMLGAEAEGVALGFETMATPPSVEFLDKMRAAVKSTVPDLELMRNANRDMMMGIVQDEKIVIDMLEISYTMARTRGMGVTEYYGRMTNAIASLHPTTLRSLGLMVDSTEAYEEYAESIGKASDKLNTQDKRLAIVNAILSNELIDNVRKAAQETDLMGDKIDQASAAKENLRMVTGELVAELLIETEVLDDLIGLFGRTMDAVQQITGPKAGMRLLEEATVLPPEVLDQYMQKLGAIQVQEMAGNIERQEAAKLYRELNDEIRQTIDYHGASETALFGWAEANYTAAVAVDEHASAVQRLNRIINSMVGGVDPSMVGRTPVAQKQQAVDMGHYEAYKSLIRSRMTDLELIQALQKEQSKYNKYTKEWVAIQMTVEKTQESISKEEAKSAKAAADANQKNLDAHQRLARFRMDDIELIRDLREEQKQYNRESAEWANIQLDIERNEQRMAKEAEKGANSRSKAMQDMIRDMEKTRAEMESMVKAQIKLTSISQEDVLRTGLGIYEDKPDEYIRRLRSAVTDEKSLWKDLLGGREGAAAELFLMQQEKAFTTGAWHELGPGFDKSEAIERIIGNVRAELEAQRHMESLINEIMMHPELAGFDRKAISQAMGMPEDYQSTGVDNVRAFAAGLEEGVPDAITKLNDSFETEFRAQEERWFVLGELSVLWFSKGIEAGQHGRAVDALVNLLSPRIAERLHGRP